MVQKLFRLASLTTIVLLISVWTLMSGKYSQDIADDSSRSCQQVEIASTKIADPTDVHDEPFLVTDKVAIIIENRVLDNLIPLVLHFASVLGPTWPILIYTSADKVHNWTLTPSLKKWPKQIQVRPLPEGTQMETHESVSDFLTQPWIWENLAPAKHVLLFQSDSILCANARHTVDDFLMYDFVGAPIAEEYGRGYNGGLSLRNREKVLELIKTHDWRAEQEQPFSKFEDQWMVRLMEELPDVSLPGAGIALRFSVETLYSEKPLGYHQIKKWHPEKMNEVAKWCPEIALAGAAAFT